MKKKKTVYQFTPEEMQVTLWDTSRYLDSDEEIRGFFVKSGIVLFYVKDLREV